MKVAIRLDRVYFDPKSGIAELVICDPELMGDDIKLKLRPQQLSVVDVKKEWFEQEDG